MKTAQSPQRSTSFASRLLAELPGPGLDEVYAARVLPLPRRRVELLGRITPARVQKALWGFEVRMGRRRKICPDEVTARYLRLFAVLGLDIVSIPYNPVETSHILPELEMAFRQVHETLLDEALTDPSVEQLRRRFPDVTARPRSFEEIVRDLDSGPEVRRWRRRYHRGKRRVYQLLCRRIRAAEAAAAGGSS
ncbi:MAG: hypothetical protein JXQ27_16050 [Acidobacteria bacterium]|nr:hypothetical protein [Acidobacteriota bacterium]